MENTVTLGDIKRYFDCPMQEIKDCSPQDRAELKELFAQLPEEEQAKYREQ